MWPRHSRVGGQHAAPEHVDGLRVGVDAHLVVEHEPRPARRRRVAAHQRPRARRHVVRVQVALEQRVSLEIHTSII